MQLHIIHLSITSTKAERTKGGVIGCGAHFGKKSRGQVSFFRLLQDCGISQQMEPKLKEISPQLFRSLLNIS